MKKIILFGYLLISSFFVSGQELEIVFQDKPLNQVFLELRDTYNLQFSFDNKKLATYRVSVNQKFPNAEEAVKFLLKNLPLTFEKAGDVFLIFPVAIPVREKNFHLSGSFADRETKESLPYTHLLINGHGLITDQRGNFSFLSTADSLFHIQASYLGYYLFDSIVPATSNYPFYLTPSVFKLKEVKIEGLKVAKSLQVGNLPGMIRLNHQVAGYLPGNGDNSVFNLLRLQPGILAAGEQSNDLIIWGSYEGQSQVLFDGFTLFGMKNFNDNISAVNPLLAKDIQVMKGGFGAEHGERVGGIVNITGMDGDVDDLHLTMSVNNMTMNGFLSIPVARKAAFIMAMRQTYYELYETGQISLGSRGRAGYGSLVDQNIYPDYNFRDLNLKFSGKADNGDSYSISFLQGRDKFSYSLEYETQRANRIYEDRENNLQTGLSALYNKGWGRNGRSELTAAYSALETEVVNIRQSGRQQPSGSGGYGNGGQGQGGSDSWQTQVNDLNQNKIEEFKLSLQNHFAVSASHNLGFGGGMYYNQVHFVEDSFDVNLVDQGMDASRLNVYLEDHFSASPALKITAGVRADYPLNLDRWYIQPRFSVSYSLSDNLKLNGAWGLYRQYIVRSSLIDELGNYRYLWAICDNGDIPVQQSQHNILGATWHKNDFTFSVEAYRKETSGLTRSVQDVETRNLYEGDSKSKGLDFFLKKDINGHSFWVAYTLSQTLEHYPYFGEGVYLRALHDQRHELKAAALVKIKSLHLSANYVFGSGFPDPLLVDDGNYERDYHRLDVAAVYRFKMKKVGLEAGISVLNVFNYENIKYANFIRVPDDQEATINFHAEAVPLTPTMFLNLSF